MCIYSPIMNRLKFCKINIIKRKNIKASVHQDGHFDRNIDSDSGPSYNHPFRKESVLLVIIATLICLILQLLFFNICSILRLFFKRLINFASFLKILLDFEAFCPKDLLDFTASFEIALVLPIVFINLFAFVVVFFLNLLDFFPKFQLLMQGLFLCGNYFFYFYFRKL